MTEIPWIEHSGGAVPNLSDKFETKWSDGDKIIYPLDNGNHPRDLAWTRTKGDGLRIVAYRILE